MTTGTFDIGLSGLLAAQNGLATTGHNIANVNTAGYSRQRVTFETRDPQFVGVGFIGKGVDTQAIVRIANQFLVDQLRGATANEAYAAKTVQLIDQVDRQLGGATLTDSIDGFFAALGDANDDPGLMATRQVLLESARTMLARFADQEEQLNGLARSVNREIGGEVSSINTLTEQIARLNVDIARGAGLASGEPPNDLVDRRDELLRQLSALVGVQTQERSDGMVNVLIGDGALVVTGGTANALGTTLNALDAARTEVTLNVGGTVTEVTGSISGGALGALVDFRDGTLEPARSAVGRLAVSLAMTVNAQHRQGMDLYGALGSDLLSVPQPSVNALPANAGAISVSFDQPNLGQLAASDYTLRYDGADFVLTRLADNSVQMLSGAGPFNLDGITISVGAAPAAGDAWLIRPTALAPRSMQVTTGDASRLALAVPVRTAADLGNLGDGAIGRAVILDETDPALLSTTTLVFNDPPTTFQVNGAGPLVPYTSGADIDLNGWRVQIEGAPLPGDTFTVRSNAGAQGDNGNGLALAALQFQPTMINGTASYQEAYGVLVGEVGAAASSARISHDALSTLTENAQTARDQLSGVNLDEEAAALLRFQQAFQAAARVISAADAAFQSLIEATRG